MSEIQTVTGTTTPDALGVTVAPHRIIIGHSCGSSDTDYHLRIAGAGSYLGFDRFGLDMIHPDEADSRLRIATLQ
jgi:phosphotriesterase-related protein